MKMDIFNSHTSHFFDFLISRVLFLFVFRMEYSLELFVDVVAVFMMEEMSVVFLLFASINYMPDKKNQLDASY